MAIELFIGFGGSGGRTLVEFARLVADDAELADIGDRKFGFLLIDTNQQELGAAKEQIEKHFDRIQSRPVIEVLDLADGVDSLPILIAARFSEIRADRNKGLASAEQKLKVARQHWYFNNDFPFDANKLPLPLREGAGQCPLASHFAAWDKLQDLQKTLDKLGTAMVANRMEEEPVNLVMVGSLAGGTGRGCWQLLSLKARMIFNNNCTPFGYFFDATVFDGVRELSETQKLRLRVNSLTGISEMVGWIINDTDSDSRSPFQLKSTIAFDTPDFAIDTRKIVDERTSTVRGITPIDQVFLITNSSDSYTFQSPEQAYQMVGAALYARAGIGKLSANGANQRQIGSCAAGIARVDVTKIREGLSDGVRMKMLGELLFRDDKADEIARSLADSFWFDESEVTHASKFKDSSVLHAIKREFERSVDTEAIKKKLDGNDVAAVIKKVETATFVTPDDNAVGKAISKVLAERLGSISGGDPKERFRTNLEKALEDASKLSIGTAKRFLDKVIEHLETKKGLIPSFDRLTVPSEKQLRDELLKDIELKSGRAFPVFGERWNDLEKKQIISLILRKALEANHKGISVGIKEYIGKFLAICSEYKRIVDEIHKQISEEKDRNEDRFTELSKNGFLPDSDLDLFRSLPRWNNQEFVLERTLKPAGALAMLEAVSKSPLRSEILKSAKAEFVDYVLNSCILEQQRISCKTEVGLQSFGSGIKQKLRLNLLNKVAVSIEDMQKHCGMKQVIHSMEERLRKFLDDNIGSLKEVEHVQDWMETFFGRRFEVKDGTFMKIEVEELLRELAYSLAQRSDPMMKLTRDETQDDSVTVYIPGGGLNNKEFKAKAKEMSVDGQKASAWRRHVAHPVKNYGVEMREDKYFSIVSFSTLLIKDFNKKKFEKVSSFDYWKTDPKLAEWLRLCESGDPHNKDSSIFTDKDDNFGIGYIHPMFVTDEKWRKRRWAPWAEGAAVQQARSANLDSVLYALCGNRPDSDEPYVKQAEMVSLEMGKVNPDKENGSQLWTMPLLQRGSGEDLNKWIFSRKAFRKGGKDIIEATGGSWKKGKEFTTIREFMKWMDWGNERGLSSDGKDFVAAITAERALIETVAISIISENCGETKRYSLKRALEAFLKEYRDGYLADRATEQKEFETPFINELLVRLETDDGFQWDSSGG